MGGDAARNASWTAGFWVPEALSCASYPEWRAFLREVLACLAEGRFPQEPFAAAVELLERWNTDAPPSAPATLASFARAVGANVTHSAGDLPPVEGFCIPGYVTACHVVARNTIGAVRRHVLTMAEKLLFFGATDVLSSSMWPTRRADILANLVRGEDEDWLDFVYRPVIPSPLPFVSQLRTNSVAGQGNIRSSVRIWLTDQHSVVSGEMRGFLPRALKPAGYNVRFDSQSVSYYCRYHGVCFTDGRVGRLLRHPRIHEVRAGAGMLDGFEQVDRVSRDIGRIAREFHHLFRTRLRTVDVFLCSIPIVWCRLYERFSKPILGVMDQPIFLFVAVSERIAWLDQFRALAQDPKNLFVCHTAFLQEQVEWQTGLRLPVVRYLASHTARWSYKPTGVAATAVLVLSMLPHRPYFLPLLRRFQELNPAFAQLALMGLDEVPAWRSGSRDRYRRIAEHRAAVVFPYDVHFIKFLELYSMGLPMFLPWDFYMWAFSWTIADPSVMEEGIARALRVEWGNATAHARPWLHPYPPYCARRGRWHFDPSACAYWAQFSDLSRLPHMDYFASLPHCLALLHAVSDEELQQRSRLMRAFQVETTRAAAQFWQQAITGLLLGKLARNPSRLWKHMPDSEA